MDSLAGDLIQRACLIDGFKERGFTITLADVDMEESRALNILWAEVEKYREEKNKKNPRG